MDGLIPWVTVLTIASALMVGVTFSLLSRLKVSLANHTDFTNEHLRSLLSRLNLALIPLVFASGVLVDFWGVRPVLILGAILLAIALFALAAGVTYERGIGGVLLGGAGTSAIFLATLVLLPRAFYGTHQLLVSINFYLVFMALGALLAYPLRDLLVRALGARTTTAFLGCLALLLGALATFPEAERFPKAFFEPSTEAHPSPLAALLDQNVWLAALVFFFYSPLEAAVSVWASAYVPDRRLDERSASWHLIAFWIGFVGVRLLAAVVQQFGYLGDLVLPWLLVLGPLATAVVLGNLAGSATLGRAWASMVALGFLLGTFLPALLGLVLTLPSLQGTGAAGTVLGALFAAGSLGSAVLGRVLFIFRDETLPSNSIQAAHASSVALRVPMLLSAVLAIGSLLFYLVSHYQQG